LPVSVKNSEALYAALKSAGISLISALPETWLVHLMRMADDDPEMTLIRLNKEEEGVGISVGAHFAGRKSAMLMQNHGLLSSVNGIVSVAQLYRIPLLMVISYRGEMGERDPWQTEGGLVTEPLLRSEALEDEVTIRTANLGYTVLSKYALTIDTKNSLVAFVPSAATAVRSGHD